MSRLHDMKTRVVKKMEKLASNQVGKMMRGLDKKIKTEDPDKMYAFLTDIVNDESFPYEMRQQCAKLCKGLSLGKTAEAIMNENIKEVAESCQSNQKQ